MKKLMTLLGVVTLTAAPAAILVSCGTPNEHLDADGNSIILEYGKNVLDENGEQMVGLDSGKILDAIKQKPGFKNKILQDVLEIANHSFLNNLDEFFNVPVEADDDTVVIGTPKNTKFEYYDDNTYSTLNNVWNNINESVDKQIEEEKELLDNDKKWKEKLVGLFPNFQKDVDDADLTFLENKYRMSLLIDGEDNIESRIQKVLIDNYHSGVNFVQVKDLDQVWSKHKALIDKDDAKYKEDLKVTNNLLLRKEFTQLYNSLVGFGNMETSSAIDKNVDTMFDVVKQYGTEGHIPNNVPDEIDKLSVNGTGKSINGILSNSQNYFLGNYYKTKAPVVISEVSFAYSAGTEFEKGINKKSISNIGSGEEASKLNAFVAELGDKTNKEWISLITNPDFADNYGGTVTKADKIMTIDGDQDSYLKSVVYDSILNKDSKNSSKIEIKPFDENEDTVEFIEQINRDPEDQQSMYGYIGVNKDILVYADAAGIHFIYKHGALGEDQFSEIKSDPLRDFENGKISKELYDQQLDLNNFNSLGTSPLKLDVTYDYDEEKSDSKLLKINSSIQNKDVKYLINNSLTVNEPNSFSTYDFVSSMKDWAKSSSADTEGSLDAKLAIYDYFKALMGPSKDGDGVKSELSDKEFLTKFFKFGPDDATDEEKEESKKLLSDISTMISTIRMGSEVTSAMTMEKQYLELVKTINAIKGPSSTTLLTPPKGLFDEPFNAQTMVNEINGSFVLLRPVESTPESTIRLDEKYYDLILDYVLKGGN